MKSFKLSVMSELCYSSSADFLVQKVKDSRIKCPHMTAKCMLPLMVATLPLLHDFCGYRMLARSCLVVASREAAESARASSPM